MFDVDNKDYNNSNNNINNINNDNNIIDQKHAHSLKMTLSYLEMKENETLNIITLLAHIQEAISQHEIKRKFDRRHDL